MGRAALGHGAGSGAIPAHELVIINSTLWALAHCGYGPVLIPHVWAGCVYYTQLLHAEAADDL